MKELFFIYLFLLISSVETMTLIAFKIIIINQKYISEEILGLILQKCLENSRTLFGNREPFFSLF